MIFLALLLSFSSLAHADLVIHDPIYYSVLGPHTQLECRYVADNKFGVLFERSAGDDVRVSLITNDENEGEKSAFHVRLLERDFTGIHLQLRSRTGNSAKEVEIVLGNRLRSDYGYRLPGAVYMATRLFKMGEDGQETSDLYLDGSFKLACQAPFHP